MLVREGCFEEAMPLHYHQYYQLRCDLEPVSQDRVFMKDDLDEDGDGSLRST